MIRPIQITLNAAHPELPLVEASTFVGSPSTAFVRGVPATVGSWSITAVRVSFAYPDNTIVTANCVNAASGVWVGTIAPTATSGRTANGYQVLADGVDENGAAVTGYVLGMGDLAVYTRDMTIDGAAGVKWYLHYFDTAPATPKKGDVIPDGNGGLQYYNGTAWLPFTSLANYYTKEQTDAAIDALAAYYITYNAAGSNFPTRAALVNATTYYSGGSVRVPTRNDYAVVLADETHGGAEWRYIYAVADGATTGQWEAQYPIETNDYGQLSNKPQINGNTLTGDKTAAQLGLASTADATLNISAGSWRCSPSTIEVETETGTATRSVTIVPQYSGTVLTGWVPATDGTPNGTAKGSVFSSDLVWEAGNDWVGNVNLTATREVSNGMVLGSQTDKPLASEAEAEVLRNGKLDNSTTDGAHTATVSWVAKGSEPYLRITGFAGEVIDISAVEIDLNDLANVCRYLFPVSSGTLALLENLAPAFSTSATYALGALCVHNRALYRCTTAITTVEAWTEAHWTEATVEDVLAALRTALDGKLSVTNDGTVSTSVKLTGMDIARLATVTGGGVVGNFTRFRVAQATDEHFIAPAYNANTGKYGFWVKNGANDAGTFYALADLAPLASPAFTGTPTAPTPTAGDSSTKVATTAFVQGRIGQKLEVWLSVNLQTGVVSANYDDGL